jgi:uncharacterized protein DUF4129
MSKATFILLLTLLLAAEAEAAAKLLNYENRVVRAAEQVERIKADREYAEEGIIYIKRLLPRVEQIEFDDHTVNVDNTWIYVLLDSYAAEKDPQRRIAILNDAAGRLRALDEHLRKGETAATANGDAREKVREILSRPAYQQEQETAVGAFVKRVRRKVDEIIGELKLALIRVVEKLLGAGAQSGWISIFVLIAVLSAVVIVIVHLLRGFRVPKAKKKKTRLVLGEEVAADGTSSELAEAGFAAARTGDFRTAIRKLYVSLLFELGERNLIELEDSATNHEYLNKVSRFNTLAAPMRFLTDRFDYVWYGMFPSSEEDFAAYLARYKEAMERARSLSEQSATVA